MVCRQLYDIPNARLELVQTLLEANSDEPCFEEVKLVLALAWQRGQWDGSDGGPGGYGEVLSRMAEAKRYEEGSEEQCAKYLVEDMQSRFELLDPSEEEAIYMESLLDEVLLDYDAARKRCAGLVLNAMGFIATGL